MLKSNYIFALLNIRLSRIKLKGVKKIVIEKKSAINDEADNDESINNSSSALLVPAVKDSKKLTRELDNDEEYESRKGGIASVFQRMFRKKKDRQ